VAQLDHGQVPGPSANGGRAGRPKARPHAAGNTGNAPPRAGRAARAGPPHTSPATQRGHVPHRHEGPGRAARGRGAVRRHRLEVYPAVAAVGTFLGPRGHAGILGACRHPPRRSPAFVGALVLRPSRVRARRTRQSARGRARTPTMRDDLPPTRRRRPLPPGRRPAAPPSVAGVPIPHGPSPPRRRCARPTRRRHRPSLTPGPASRDRRVGALPPRRRGPPSTAPRPFAGSSRPAPTRLSRTIACCSTPRRAWPRATDAIRSRARPTSRPRRLARRARHRVRRRHDLRRGGRRRPGLACRAPRLRAGR
jgi:hypothetical protein